MTTLYIYLYFRYDYNDMNKLHPLQKQLLDLSTRSNLEGMTLREIAKMLGTSNAATIQYHLRQLQDKNLLGLDRQPVTHGRASFGSLNRIPIYGAANCGPATITAEDTIEGYLSVSPTIQRQSKDIFAIRAVGNSMNNASVNGSTAINDGDYVLVKRTDAYDHNDYVVTIIDNCANIKKFKRGDDSTIMLLSESRENFPPIYLSEDDNPMVIGKVIKVLKS